MPRARIAVGLWRRQEAEFVLDRKFGLERAAVAFGARQQLRQMMIALRADHDVDGGRAADDLLPSACATQPATAICMSRPLRAASSLATRSRPSSE